MKNTKRDETFLRETRHVIERHIELYPKCEPDDIVKLLYQSEFGCGHFVRSKEIAEEYLKREYEACMLTTKAAAAGEHPLTDETGGMFVRVHLEPLARYGIPLSRLAELFVRSSEVRTGSTDGMLKKLSLLKEICRQGKTPFERRNACRLFLRNTLRRLPGNTSQRDLPSALPSRVSRDLQRIPSRTNRRRMRRFGT